MKMKILSKLPEFTPIELQISLTTVGDLKVLAAMLNASNDELVNAGSPWGLTYEEMQNTDSDALYSTIAPYITPYMIEKDD